MFVQTGRSVAAPSTTWSVAFEAAPGEDRRRHLDAAAPVKQGGHRLPVDLDDRLAGPGPARDIVVVGKEGPRERRHFGARD